MAVFKALWVTEAPHGVYETQVVERDTGDLPAGDVLIRVQYSSLNYKDALSASGNRGVTRKYPHTPGIDAAGVVAESSVAEFAAGDGDRHRLRPGHEHRRRFRPVHPRARGLGDQAPARPEPARGDDPRHRRPDRGALRRKLERSGLRPTMARCWSPAPAAGSAVSPWNCWPSSATPWRPPPASWSRPSSSTAWGPSRSSIAPPWPMASTSRCSGTVGRRGGHRRRRHPLQRGQVVAVRRQRRLLRPDRRRRLQGLGAAVHPARGQPARGGLGGAAAGGQGIHVGQAVAAMEARQPRRGGARDRPRKSCRGRSTRSSPASWSAGCWSTSAEGVAGAQLRQQVARPERFGELRPEEAEMADVAGADFPRERCARRFSALRGKASSDSMLRRDIISSSVNDSDTMGVRTAEKARRIASPSARAYCGCRHQRRHCSITPRGRSPTMPRRRPGK